MSYKTRVYKTMKGYLKAAGCDYVRACDFFNGKQLCWTPKFQTFYAKPSNELREQIAELWEKRIWSKSNRTRLNALKDGVSADFSFLQCFYVGVVNGHFYASNSLSGDAYDYCKRMFTKSAY